MTSAQIKEHRGAVLDLIEMYLRGEFMQLVKMSSRLFLNNSVCLSSGHLLVDKEVSNI